MLRLVIHGGAGTLPREQMTPERDKEFHAALAAALRIGHGLLKQGGTALDAVEMAVVQLEDCPLFNAGRGSSFNREGRIEMEAAIMEGKCRAAGAGALLRQVRNPICLARAVMERTPHVCLVGEAAETFAKSVGLKIEPEEYFRTQFRHDLILKLRESGGTALSEDVVATSTVGAVALDAAGHLAAAVSSGGLTNKMPGRVGQAAFIGSGVYADDAACAVSCTGTGETFIRTAAAFDVAARMQYRGADVARAARDVIHERVAGIGGRGGLIALDRSGQLSLPFNTAGMYRGWVDETGILRTGIYDGEIEHAN